VILSISSLLIISFSPLSQLLLEGKEPGGPLDITPKKLDEPLDVAPKGPDGLYVRPLRGRYPGDVLGATEIVANPNTNTNQASIPKTDAKQASNHINKILESSKTKNMPIAKIWSRGNNKKEDIEINIQTTTDLLIPITNTAISTIKDTNIDKIFENKNSTRIELKNYCSSKYGKRTFFSEVDKRLPPMLYTFPGMSKISLVL
jgi:hypothetical protein